MTEQPATNSTSPSTWIWLILIILTLPCAVQWMVSKTYSQHNILSDMRFTRVAERAAQLDKTASAKATALLQSGDFELEEAYRNSCRQLTAVLVNMNRSAPGGRYSKQTEQLIEISNQRREIEQASIANIAVDSAFPVDSLTSNLSYMNAEMSFNRNVQMLIGQIENRTSQTLEKTQVITSAVQYAIIAFAFVLFMNWRQHARYVEEENRKEKHREQLERAKTVAEDANRIKSEFLANMSHEMRTPLTAIMGMTHLSREAESCPDQIDRLGKIENAAANLLKIVNDVLDLSKIEAGKLELESIPFHVSDVLEQVRSVVDISIEDKQLELVVECDDDCPAVMGDPFRLNQILINLVSNAIKFTEKGKITLNVSPGECTDETVTLKFKVTDTGVGMTEKQVSKIFGMFAQADGSTTRKYGGTGLGLCICKRILEAMDGSIMVESSAGKGSCFSFEIPFQQCGPSMDGTTNIPRHIEMPSRTEQQMVKHSLTLDRLTTDEDDVVVKTGIAQHVSQHIEHLESLVDASMKLELNRIPSAIRELTGELDNRLEQFDSRSVDTFTQLTQMLDEAQKERIKGLDLSIRRFDFVDARKQLVEFCDSFERPVNTNADPAEKK